jgi:(p)ppGpp synthase/HD superfamily hydrolase
MKDINDWQAKFEPCQYSDRLINKLLLLNKAANNPVDIQEVKKAIYYAKKYHGDQKRKSGEPYYSHPIEVAYMVSDYLFRTDIMVTSVLHDTIEDTALTFEMIMEIFGALIANQVMDLTRVKPEGKISASAIVDSLFKQKKYEVLLIKQFDRLHNMQTIAGVETPKKIIEETLLSFITLSEYLKIPMVKKELIKLCYQALGITAPLQADCELISENNRQSLSPIFQNEIARIKSLYLPES